jgi:transposase
METPIRNPYPSDVTDDEASFVAPCLTLMSAEAPQRRHGLREVFNALRWIVRTGAQWRMLPTIFPPWAARLRRLARDDERLPDTVKGLHVLAFACLMLHRLLTVAVHCRNYTLADD